MRDPKRPSEWLARQLPVWRKRRGLTVEQLADRVKALGEPLGRVTITKIENGDRGISLDEGLLLAAALNVPPAVLWFPVESGKRVAVTPKSNIHPHLAHEWLAGKQPLATTERSATGLGQWKGAAGLLSLYDELRAAQDATQRAWTALRNAEYVGEEQSVRKARVTFARRLGDLADVRGRMREAGLTPPKLPEEWIKPMDELGLEVE